MAWQITPGMEEVDYHDLRVRLDEDREMTADTRCLKSIRQATIEQDAAALLPRGPVRDRFAACDQFLFIDFGLAITERRLGP